MKRKRSERSRVGAVLDTRLAKSFAAQRRGWIFAEMMAALTIIGVLDFITAHELRLSVFYTGPIFVAAWFCGTKSGMLTAAFSGVIWWCANWFSGDPDLHSWVHSWETFRHFGFFLIVAWAGAALRAGPGRERRRCHLHDRGFRKILSAR